MRTEDLDGVTQGPSFNSIIDLQICWRARGLLMLLSFNSIIDLQKEENLWGTAVPPSPFNSIIDLLCIQNTERKIQSRNTSFNSIIDLQRYPDKVKFSRSDSFQFYNRSSIISLEERLYEIKTFQFYNRSSLYSASASDLLFIGSFNSIIDLR